MFGLFKKKNNLENAEKAADKDVQKVEEKKEEKAPKKLTEINDFDQSEYVREIFNTIFHSIRNEEWEREISWKEMKFSKSQENKNNNRTFYRNTIQVTVEYGFDLTTKIFKVSDVKIHPPSGSQLSYPKVYQKYDQVVSLDDETMTFLYDVYADWKNKENSNKKNKIDESINSIKGIVGLSSIRDSKIDELLK